MKEIALYKLEEMKGDTVKGFYATASLEVQKMFDYYKDMHKKRIELNSRIQAIAPHDPERLGHYRKTDKKELRDVRELPMDVYSSNISIEIGKSWVKTMDFENLQGLIIENPAFAKTMKEIFEIVWESTGQNKEAF